jgi:ribosomal protein S6--L-glutamate ligase
MRIAVVGKPNGWSSERLAAALRTAGADSSIIDLAQCALRLPDPRVFHRGQPLEGLTGAFVKKIGDTAGGWMVRERINVLRHLQASGVRVLSPPDCLEVAVNRYRMTLELAQAGLPVPETILTEDPAEAERAVERMGAAVLKPLFTSKGRGMQRLEPGSHVRPILADHAAAGRGPYYLQAFVKHPGRDLGVAVMDGRVLGAYWRVAGDHQWMTTILAGGRYAPAEPPPEALEIARAAAQRFGLTFTGVDLIETPAGGWAVLEVSAFGGFRGLLQACRLDAAPVLAAHLCERLGGVCG